MSSTASVREDLDYVASVVRGPHTSQAPAIYFLWAGLVLVGFALPDFAPRYAGPYWFIAGILGGITSGLIARRASRAAGINDQALSRRCTLHWIVGGIGFLLAALPMFTGAVDPAHGASLFLLVGGLVYTFAGIHLERGILWGGVVMLIGYVALLLFHPPYLWTICGIVIAAALLLSGIHAARTAGRAAA